MGLEVLRREVIFLQSLVRLLSHFRSGGLATCGFVVTGAIPYRHPILCGVYGHVSSGVHCNEEKHYDDNNGKTQCNLQGRYLLSQGGFNVGHEGFSLMLFHLVRYASDRTHRLFIDVEQ